VFLAIVCVISARLGRGQSSDGCDSFHNLIRTTYDFKPSKLPPPELDRKSAEMDNIWDLVAANAKLVPCLRKALAERNADPWFLFDSSMLLVRLDPSPESWKIQVRGLIAVDLDDVNLGTWVAAVAARAIDGLDVSEAGAHWLSYDGAQYPVPEPGMSVDAAMGALFIYGSIDETIATPALRKVVQDGSHPRRDVALAILKKQATAESFEVLKQINALEKPDLIPPRSQPKTTRDQLVEAFASATSGDWAPLQDLMDKVPDVEKDVVAVLKPEDISLLRQVRRHIVATTNPHAADYYDSFTQMLMTLVWK
jgi:hypothetical protein